MNKLSIKNALILFAGLFLVACASTPGHQLSLAEVQTLSYTDTEVRISESARIKWGRYQREQGRISKGNPIDGSTLESADKKKAKNTDFAYTALFPSAEQHKNKMLVDPVKEYMKLELDKLMTGDRPVKGIVEINNVEIIGAAQSLLFGGANTINASFRLVDTGTNATLANLPFRAVGNSKGSGEIGLFLNELGKRNKYQRTTDVYAKYVSRWLKEKGEK
ncbi:MAG: hypothetical protein ABJN04_06440 [Hyphomicrobiales bacterium]